MCPHAILAGEDEVVSYGAGVGEAGELSGIAETDVKGSQQPPKASVW